MLDSDGMNAEIVHRQRSSGPDFPTQSFAKTFAEMNHANLARAVSALSAVVCCVWLPQNQRPPVHVGGGPFVTPLRRCHRSMAWIVQTGSHPGFC
jgi:hypothetical protein